jgi:hypothetical protein
MLYYAHHCRRAFIADSIHAGFAYFFIAPEDRSKIIGAIDS